jgi:hypothetical protein
MAKKAEQKKATPKKQELKATIIDDLKKLPWWIVSIAFFLTTIIFFWDQLFGDQYFWEDFAEYVFPTQTFAAREFANGSIPFWNPYTFVGMPFFADLQVGFLYPLNRLLSLFISESGRLPISAVQFITIIHFFIAQIAMYYFARFFKISSWGAIISAISYGFSMILVCHVIHPMMLAHLAWFPLVAMFYIKGVQLGDIRSSVWSGLILGFSLLSGHPQTALYEGLFLLIFFIWFTIASIKSKAGNSIIKLIIAGVLPIIIAAGIFSVQYLPSQVLADNSQREEISYEKATEGSLQFKQIASAAVPNIFGKVTGDRNDQPTFYLKFRDTSQIHFYWETAFYFGIASLILGLFAMTYLIKTRYGAFFTFIACFGFLYALGENFLLFDVFSNLPLFGSFRNPARIMFFVVIAFAILSGFGFDLLWKELKSSIATKRLIIVSSIPLLIALLTVTGMLPSAFGASEIISSGIEGYGIVALFFVLAVFAFTFAVNKYYLNPIAGATAIAILLFIDLNIAGGDFNRSPNNPEDTYTLNPQLKETLKPNPPDDLFRVSMRLYNPSFMAMNRNQGMMDEIMLIEGYNPLILQRVLPPAPEKDPERSRRQIHDLYNVKYDIGIDREQGGASFFEHPDRYPRAWLVKDYKILASEEIEATMKSDYYDFHNIAFLESEPRFGQSSKYSGNNYVKCLEYENNYMKYEVNAETNSVLVFSEIYYPEWNAYIDEKETEIIRANYSFRAVAVPAGKHQIEMKYESSAFNFGLVISILTLVVSIALLIFINPNSRETESQKVRKK